jgi:hypothetical protein
MTVCLKCGAENPLTHQYCARCEMPLPHSGVGHTLQGGTVERPGGTAALPVGSPAQTALGAPPKVAPAPPPTAGLAQTLFGVPPLAHSPAPAATSAQAAAPASGLGQTLFGVAPPVAGRSPAAGNPSAVGPTAFVSAARPPPGAPSPEASRAAPHSMAALPGQPPPGAGFPPVAADAGLAQRTLMGVAPQPLAARPGSGTQVAIPNAPAQSRREPVRPDQNMARPPRNNTAPFEPVRNAATMLGTTSGFPQATRPQGGTSPTADTAPAGSDALARAADALVAPPMTEPAIRELPPLPSLGPNPLHARTQLGVAIPGIAPLRSGAGAALAQAAGLTDARSELPAAAPPPMSVMAPSRPQVPRGALVLLGSGAVLLAAAIAFALLWTGTRSISAGVASDPSGKERIDLVCSDCPDGTQLSLGEVTAEVRDRKAYLVPKTALALGENTLQFSVQRPGASPKSQEVRLPPVEYRIHPDTSTLVGDNPRLRLDIEALPGTQVLLGTDGVTLDAAGHGQRDIDVSGQLLGQSTDISTFEQAVPYLITAPSGKQYRGELRVKIGVTPLLLEAPGTDSVTDMERFMLAGRTTNGAEVWVAGAALPVDASGRFAQLMSIESVGQTNVTVRATQRGLAPRFASFRLERVKSLDAAANVRRQGALALSDVVKDIAANVGKTVLVHGRIEEVRVDGQRSLLVLAADRDCTGRECLARLLYGGLRKLERGARVTAIGKVLGAAPSQNVPEIEVSLLL